MKQEKPRYKHDCSTCTYLGQFVPLNSTCQPIIIYDLYAHQRDRMVELIARYSDNPPDYMSGCFFIGYPEEENTYLQIPIFKEIYNRYNDKISLKIG